MRVALVRESRTRAAIPEGFVERAVIGGARLIGEPDTPCLAAGSAALIGRAFRATGLAPCDALSRDDTAQLIASGGAWAIRHLWGNFILVWEDAQGVVYILRSPVTGPAVFQVAGIAPKDGSGGTLDIAFTDLELVRALGFAADRPDPSAVDAQLRHPLLRGPRTEIEGVFEILPGEIVRLGDPMRQPGSWLPWDYALVPPRRVAPEDLGTLVRGVTRAWSDRFERIQLELSGGIDSSIVAACLAERRGTWRAVTMATAEPDGDERVYARAVAAHARIPLAELLLAAEPADPLSPLGRTRIRPGGFGLLAPSDQGFAGAAREFAADAIFSGTGGDGIFGYQTTMAPALDALRFDGPGAAWRAAHDIARITGDTMWSALRFGLRGLAKGFRLWPTDDSLLSPRFAGGRPWHPWLEDADRIAPGQRRYALGILTLQSFLDGYDRCFAFPKIAPLLSQPLVEFGLGVPSWQWGEGGINRALARRAFEKDLPEIVLSRQGKGRILSLFLPAFEAGRKPIGDFLLGGWLADAGIIDVEGIGALLAGRRTAGSFEILRILQLVDMERWVRSIVDPRSVGDPARLLS